MRHVADLAKLRAFGARGARAQAQARARTGAGRRAATTTHRRCGDAIETTFFLRVTNTFRMTYYFSFVTR